MDYELEPRRIASRRRPVLPAAVALAAVLVLAAGWLGRDGAPREPVATPSAERVDPSAAAVAPRTRAPRTAARPAAPWRLAGPDPTLPPPGALDCTTVPQAECAAAIRAARRVVVALGARPVEAIIHASLVCGSYRDCPHSLIGGAHPLGSVVIRFDDGRETWVNVVRPRANRHGADVDPAARVVHWTTWAG